MAQGDAAYRGLPGAFIYSFRMSESRVYKSYVVISAILTCLITILFTLGLIGIIAGTIGASELVTLVRSFFILVGVLVVFPIIAPVILVARRLRLSEKRSSDYDAAMAFGGYAFIISLYVGLLLPVPPEQQEPVVGVMGAIISIAYSLPQISGFVPPLICAGMLFLIHRRFR